VIVVLILVMSRINYCYLALDDNCTIATSAEYLGARFRNWLYESSSLISFVLPASPLPSQA